MSTFSYWPLGNKGITVKQKRSNVWYDRNKLILESNWGRELYLAVASVHISVALATEYVMEKTYEKIRHK